MGTCSPALTSQVGGSEYNSLANDLTNHISIVSPLLLDSKLGSYWVENTFRCQVPKEGTEASGFVLPQGQCQ